MNTGTGTNVGFETETDAMNPFAQSLLTFEQKFGLSKPMKVGTKVNGILISKNARYALIDFRSKDAVRVDINAQELVILNKIELGEQVQVLITGIKDQQNFEVTGSLYELKIAELSEFLDSAFEKRTVLTGIPTELNHAGYNVNINIEDQEMALFMPHLLTDVNKLPDSQSILNTEIEFVLEKVKKDNQTSYIASRKGYLLTLANKERRKLVKNGQYHGYVTGCTDFAVFVQFNQCLTGMIHKSNLTPKAIEMLPNIPAGTTIEFFVKDIIKDRLFLTQVLKDSLWDSIAVNDELTGTVSSLKDFGLLVELDYETKGLLHKSVLSLPVDSYKKGDKVHVIVTAVNKNNRQITLALK